MLNAYDKHIQIQIHLFKEEGWTYRSPGNTDLRELYMQKGVVGLKSTESNFSLNTEMLLAVGLTISLDKLFQISITR